MISHSQGWCDTSCCFVSGVVPLKQSWCNECNKSVDKSTMPRSPRRFGLRFWMLRPACLPLDSRPRSHSHGPPGYGHPGHGQPGFGTPPPAYGHAPLYPGYPGHPPAHLPCHGHARNLVQSLAQINRTVP